MKNIFLSVFFLLSINAISQTPRAGGINNSQATVQFAVHPNFTGVQPTNNNAFAVYDFATNFDYMLGLKSTDNIAEGATNKYFSSTLARNAFSAGYGLNYSAGIYGLDSSTQGILSSVSGKLNTPIGTTLQYLRGDASLATFPTIPTDNNQLGNGSGFTTASSTNTFTNKSGNISQWTNNSGYITSFTEIDPTTPTYSKSLSAFSIIKSSTDPLYKAIGYSPTSLEITTALGYTPYNSTNPSNFITGITSGQVTTALGFTPLSAEVDGSITNEIQSLSIVGSTVSLSNGGGSVVVPNNTYTAGSGISIASNVVTNTNPDQIIVLNSGNRILITGTYPNFTISYIEPIINTPVTRTLNSNFTISNTKQAIVSYSVTCSVTNPLLVGTSTAMSYLEYSINSGTTWLLPAQNGNSSGVGLTVTVQLTNGQTGVLSGVIPANALVRLRTAITGTASVTYVTGTEIY